MNNIQHFRSFFTSQLFYEWTKRHIDNNSNNCGTLTKFNYITYESMRPNLKWNFPVHDKHEHEHRQF